MYFITTKRMLEVCFFQHTPTFIIEPKKQRNYSQRISSAAYLSFYNPSSSNTPFMMIFTEPSSRTLWSPLYFKRSKYPMEPPAAQSL